MASEKQTVASVLAAAETLTVEERRDLIELLTLGLDDEADAGPPQLSEAWQHECARRLAEYDAGLVETVSWDELKARWQARRQA